MTLKSFAKYLDEAVQASKNLPFVEAIAKAAPWWVPALGKSLAESVAPIKFVASIFEALTAVPDPAELGRIAFTVSYEHAVVQAAAVIGAPKETAKQFRHIDEAIPSPALDFSALSYDMLVLHPFIAYADGILEETLLGAGYSERQRREFINDVHQRFVTHFKTLLSHGDTREKFTPLRDLLAISTDQKSAVAALLEHAEYQRALFDERPVFGKEAFALSDVYIDTECGVLEWGDIRDGENRVDPFDEKYGGRHRVSETVLRLLRDPEFRDAIVVQGVAGAGKSAFTQWLAEELVRSGLRPIRILLRDVRLDRNRPIREALGRAIRYEDESLRTSVAYPRPDDPLAETLFNERVRFGDAFISPYVLILDGWDEISISVSEGFKLRLDRMLEQIRTEFLHNRSVPVRVILTGRPSAAVSESSFLLKTTPVLTLRPISPDDLQHFIEKLARAVRAPRFPHAGTGWSQLDTKALSRVVARYRHECRHPEQQRTLEVLGLPLLAFLTVRLLSEPGAAQIGFDLSPTALYRNLVDLTCSAGGKSADSNEPTDQQFRLIGGPLRDLLRRTAAAMTVFGQENISYDELKLRLGFSEDLSRKVDNETADNVLSQLMISYYFKSGHTDLGCEFLHKSFREYLFAEGVVETLKQYGREAPPGLTERSPYWRDFEESDRRHRLSRDLASQLSAQWLSSEIARYIEDLIAWEIGRAVEPSRATTLQNAQPTEPIEMQQWEIVREALADLWEWWGEGVHLRPQPVRSKRQELTFTLPYAQELVELAMPLDIDRSELPQPLRYTTVDSHLGDSLFDLVAAVHFHVARAEGWIDRRDGVDIARTLWLGATDPGQGPRTCQTSVKQDQREWVMFAPSGRSRGYWSNYVSRINAGGWRPRSSFPSGAFMQGIDLRETVLSCVDVPFHTMWNYSNLDGCFASGSIFFGHYFGMTSMRAVIFDRARFDEAVFFCCDLNSAILTQSDLLSAEFTLVNLSNSFMNRIDARKAEFDHCRFENADLRGGIFEGATFRACDFTNAKIQPPGALHPDLAALLTSDEK